LADEAGVLDEFKSEMPEMKKDALAERVADGRITREQADAIMAKIEERLESCDGAGCGRAGGMGKGQRRGMGKGLKDGSCGR
jgi:hypothetical protein